LAGLDIYLVDYNPEKAVLRGNLVLAVGIATAHSDFAGAPVLDSADDFLGHKG